MSKSYTIQFECNGETYTRLGSRNDNIKTNADLSDLVYN